MEGNPKEAMEAYRAAGNQEHGTPYAVSAVYRLRMLETGASAEPRESLFKQIAKEPELQGWFLNAGRWTWSTTRHAAWQDLVDLHSDRLSFRLFAFLRSKSVLPPVYAYVFILLVIAAGVKVLELPLMVKAARQAPILRTIAQQTKRIQETYSNDPEKVGPETMKLYQRYGASPWGGCLTGLVDLIFVIWSFVALRSYSPQLALDKSSFPGVSDIMEWDWKIAVIWVIVMVIAAALNMKDSVAEPAQMAIGIILLPLVIIGIGWYWQWSAYVFIFWSLLTVVGVVFQILLMPLRRTA
jgi:YidC/Oxa1 family membrane protein insertase